MRSRKARSASPGSKPRTLTSPDVRCRCPSRISTVAGTVGAKQGKDLASSDVDINSVDGLDVAVPLDQAPHPDCHSSSLRDASERQTRCHRTGSVGDCSVERDHRVIVNAASPKMTLTVMNPGV